MRRRETLRLWCGMVSVAVVQAGSVYAATWTGGAGTWTDPGSWDTVDYPGELDNGALVTIRGSGNTVTLSGNLPFAIGGTGYTNPFTLDQQADLNINGNITARAAVYIGA